MKIKIWQMPTLAIGLTACLFSTLPLANFYTPKILILKIATLAGLLILSYTWLKTRCIQFSLALPLPLALLFIVFLITSTVPLSMSVLSQPKNLEYLTWIDFFLFAWLFKLDREQLNFSLTVLEILTIPLIVYGFVQHFGFDPIHWNPGGKRIFSTIGNADQFAYFLSILMSVSAIRFIRKPTLKRLLLIEAQTICLFWSFTRTPFLALAITGALTVGILAVTKPFQRLLPRALMLAFSLILTFTLSFKMSHNSGEVQRFTLNSLNTPDVIGRRYLFTKGLEVLSLSPLKGVGLGNFSFAYLPLRNNDPSFYRSRLAFAESTQNTFLDVFTGTGIPGGIAFLLIWISALFLLMRLGGVSDEEKWDRLTIFAPLVTAFVCLQLMYPDPATEALTGFLLGGCSIFSQRKITLPVPKLAGRVFFFAVITLCVVGSSLALSEIVADFYAGAGVKNLNQAYLASAKRAFSQATSWNSYNPVYFQQLGFTDEISGNAGAALKNYSRAIELQNNNPYYWGDLGRLAGKNGWKNLALQAYVQTLQRDPYNPNFYHDAAYTAFRFRCFRLAVHYGMEAYSLDPDSPENGYIYAISLFGAGEKQRTDSLIQTELKKNPRNPDFMTLQRQEKGFKTPK